VLCLIENYRQNEVKLKAAVDQRTAAIQEATEVELYDSVETPIIVNPFGIVFAFIVAAHVLLYVEIQHFEGPR
jgi:hypothetical protein